jgi:hypothetical protein
MLLELPCPAHAMFVVPLLFVTPALLSSTALRHRLCAGHLLAACACKYLPSRRLLGSVHDATGMASESACLQNELKFRFTCLHCFAARPAVATMLCRPV